MFTDFTPSQRLTDLSILVVEDNSISRQLIAGLLKSLDFTNITVAADGDEAMRLVEAAGRAPDVILCDWQMPGLDGLSLLSIINAEFPDAIFIMVTATDTVEAAMLAKAHGAHGYVLKPVTKAKLQNAIESAASRKRTLDP